MYSGKDLMSSAGNPDPTCQKLVSDTNPNLAQTLKLAFETVSDKISEIDA
jgi:hypothetical protein